MGFAVKQILILLGLAVIMLAAGCTSQFNNKALEPVSATMQKPVYPLARAEVAPGDGLDVRFLYHPEFNTVSRVGMDGTIFLPLMGNIKVAGKTTREIHAELMAFYKKELRSPDITITTDQPDAMVFVAGEVKAGGPLPFRTYMTAAQALAAALPNMVDGDIKSVVLIRKDEANPEQYIGYLVNGDFAEGNAMNVYLSPGDVIVVPRKGIVMAGDAVRQYIKDILPFNMNVSYGFVYEVHADDNN